jgi:small neutral amino acid transporter SnatA (MarC family)
MAIEVIFDTAQNSSYLNNLDVSTSQPVADKIGAASVTSKAEKHEGNETVNVSAVIVFVCLALLWLFGGYVFKNARI